MTNQAIRGSSKFIYGDWQGLVRDGWLEQFADIELLMSAGESVVDKPDRTVRRIETTRGVIYYKHTSSAGKGQLAYFLKSLLRQPRSLAVWRVSEAMLAAGLGCPLPLLAASSRKFASFNFENIIFSAEIPYPRISDLLGEAKDHHGRVRILRQIGQGIRELHQKGFVHGDCLPGNICMDAEGKLFFLDNDRTVRKNACLARNARLRNLIQFCSRALAWLPDETLLNHFLDGYEQDGQKKQLKRSAFMAKLGKRVAQLEKASGKKILASKLG